VKATGAVFHPAREWLIENKSIAEKEGCVEVYDYGAWINYHVPAEPAVILHELAHSYMNIRLSEIEPLITQTYEKVMATGKYDESELKGTAYAKTDIWEYFACTTEAFFSSKRFWHEEQPRDNTELQDFDPDSYNMAVQIYGTTGAESQVLQEAEDFLNV